jgi:Uma2 family endonuclease
MGTPQRRSLTEREYLDREAQAAERHEYVDGIVYAMAGAGERHNRIAGNVFVTLRLAARATPCGVYVSDMKLSVAHVKFTGSRLPRDRRFEHRPADFATLSPAPLQLPFHQVGLDTERFAVSAVFRGP